jgi:hypothetical protein
MFYICEPTCRGSSHEKVNSGLLYGLSLAFPEEKILFFADSSHIQGLKKILKTDGISIDNIEFCPISFKRGITFLSRISYTILFRKLFSQMVAQNIDKIVLFSINPFILSILKKLKTKEFKNIHTAMILHGAFEDVAHEEYTPWPVPDWSSIKESENRSMNLIRRISRKIRNKGFLKILSFGLKRVFTFPLIKYKEKLDLKFLKNNRFKDLILDCTPLFYHFIVLSEHIYNNISNYLEHNKVDFKTITMPIHFKNNMIQPKNAYVKFAVFGYGDSVLLYKLAKILSTKNILGEFEIRVIGMDTRGIESFNFITCPGGGKFLDREEMESQVQDIDIFLNFYDSTQYILSCSGSIFEAISYVKPLIHLKNDCFNYYNTYDQPIGFSCSNLDEMAENMINIIDNFKDYNRKIEDFKINIMQLREKISLENNIPHIRKCFDYSKGGKC